MDQQAFEAMPGHTIDEACKEAVRLAAERGESVTFEFNGVPVTAEADSDPGELARGYMAECERRSAAYRASPEYAEQQRLAAEREAERTAERDAALVGAPEAMSLRDPEGWRKAVEINSDGYGGAVMTFAERWARMMEAAIARGETVAACASRTAHLADDEGITGFMYGCAVQILSQVWRHGEQLRRWHNLDTQIGTEGEAANESGGVLNPALLSIGG